MSLDDNSGACEKSRRETLMKLVSTYFKQLFLLNKRLCKKKSFLALLLMFPLLTLGMQWISGQESGVLHILLYEQKPSDACTEQIVNELVQMDSVIWFERIEQLEQAYEQVQVGKADAIWVFSDMQEKIDAIFQNGHREAIVKIVEQTDSVVLHLAREKLYGVLYPYLSYELFSRFIDDLFTLDETVTEEELRSFYEESTVKGNLFQVAYSTSSQETEQESSYFVMPLRGVLAVFLFLCGAACTMYHKQDREDGLYLQLSETHKFWLEIGSYIEVLWCVGIFVIGAFWFLGIFTTWRRELVTMLLYDIIIAGICYLLRRCLKTTTAIGVSLPVFAIIFLVCSSVFLQINSFRTLQNALPVTHYIQAVHTPALLDSMLWYAVSVWFIVAVVKWFIRE